MHVASLPFNLLYSSLAFITERRAFAYIAIGTEFYQLAVVKHRLFAGIITYFREGVVLKSYSNYDSVFIKLYSITDGRASTHTIQNLITRRTDELEKSILISPIVQCYKSCSSLKKKKQDKIHLRNLRLSPQSSGTQPVSWLWFKAKYSNRALPVDG